MVLFALFASQPFAQAPAQRELFSDAIAYRQFTILASVRENASAVDRRRRDAFVKRIGLSPADEASLKAALTDVRRRLENVSAGTPHTFDAAAASSAVSQRLRNRVDGIFHSADERIRAELSEDGLDRLDRFIREHVKQQIRVYGTSR
jgi:hypothetical protein